MILTIQKNPLAEFEVVKQATLLITQQSTWHLCALLGQQFLSPSREPFLKHLGC